jgi:tight adherence protein B
LEFELALSILLFVLLMATAILLYSGRERAVTDRDKKVMHRLGLDAARRPAGRFELLGESEAGPSPASTHNFIARALGEMIDQAGVTLSPGLLTGMIIGLFLFGFVVSVGYFHAVPALAFATVLASVPVFYLRFLRKGRLKIFGQQLPYVLDLLKSALEAGHTLLRALELAAENSPEPMGSELRRVVEQVRVGIPLPGALESIYRRIPEEELGFLAIAVRIQAQVGSSLAEILHHVAAGVRTRQRLQQQMRMLTAQSRTSAVIVTLLPFVVLAAFALIRPGYAAPLFRDPTGIKLLETAIVLDLMAFLAMRRIARVEY